MDLIFFSSIVMLPLKIVVSSYSFWNIKFFTFYDVTMVCFLTLKVNFYIIWSFFNALKSRFTAIIANQRILHRIMSFPIFRNRDHNICSLSVISSNKKSFYMVFLMRFNFACFV